MQKESGFTWKLGAFILTGLLLFVFTIYYVGKQKNLFGSTFKLRVQFKSVNGLKEGNNVRLSGINIGTVDNIEQVSDTTVMVDLVIRKKIQRFIKTNAKASIGSDGLMGDKVLTISSVAVKDSNTIRTVTDNDIISSVNAVEMEDIMKSLKGSVDNAGVITDQLAQFTYKMNNSNGVLSKLISDKEFSGSLKNTLTNLQTSSDQFAKFTLRINEGGLGKALDSTMINIQEATKGLNENMEAAKHNFLLRGFFNKKKKAEAKKQALIKKQNDLYKQDSLLHLKDSIQQHHNKQ